MAGCGRDPDDRKVDRILESGPPKKKEEDARTTRRFVLEYIHLIVFCISKKIDQKLFLEYLNFKRNILSEMLYVSFKKDETKSIFKDLRSLTRSYLYHCSALY